jgi:hypothetical protein
VGVRRRVREEGSHGAHRLSVVEKCAGASLDGRICNTFEQAKLRREEIVVDDQNCV